MKFRDMPATVRAARLPSATYHVESRTVTADTTPLPAVETPEADSPEDVLTRTIPLDGGAAVVEHAEDRVEVTIRLGGRTVLGIALSHMEAANLGRAIASPAGATTGDLFHLADELGVDAAEIMRLQNRAVIS